MKLPRWLLPLSVAGNLALAAVALTRTPLEPRFSPAGQKPAAVSRDARVESPPRRQETPPAAPAASFFEAATAGALAERLHAAGFPPAMIRAAVATRFGSQAVAAAPDDDPIETEARRRILASLGLPPQEAEALESASPEPFEGFVERNFAPP